MKNLELIKEYYIGLSHKGKVFTWLVGVVAVLIILEIVRGCSG